MKVEGIGWWPAKEEHARFSWKFKKHRFLIWPIMAALVFSTVIIAAAFKDLLSVSNIWWLFTAIFLGVAVAIWWNKITKKYVKDSFLDYSSMDYRLRITLFLLAHSLFISLFLLSIFGIKVFAVFVAAFFLAISIYTILAFVWLEKKHQTKVLCVEPIFIEDYIQVYYIWFWCLFVVVSL